MACLDAGKHVEIEIPLCDSLADGEAMVAKAAETGLVVMVGHTRRFNPSHQWVRRRITGGEFHIQQMDVQRYFFRRTNTNALGEPRRWTDHLLWHHAAHSVDLFQYQTGGAIVAAHAVQGPIHPELGTRWTCRSSSRPTPGRSSRCRCRSTTRGRSARSSGTSATPVPTSPGTTTCSFEGLGFVAVGAVCPHRDREEAANDILRSLGLEFDALTLDARTGPLTPDQRIVDSAWRLDALGAAYDAFVAEFSGVDPHTPAEAFRATIRLVDGWRQFPFRDPELPMALLPTDWPGHAARELFESRRRAWASPALTWYLAAESER